MAKNISLLGSTSRVEVPYIKVKIGDYTLGVYRKTEANEKLSSGFYRGEGSIVYPNYISSLNIIKTNGQINQYSLDIIYPITPSDDPNFFEKIFSSVSQTRKIIFSYGDMSLPTYVYREEEATIIDIQNSFDIASSKIKYTINAISSAGLLSSGSYPFLFQGVKKPSDIIKEILYAENDYYGLQQIFYGMTNRSLVESKKLIPGDDKAVPINAQEGMSALDYLSYLVSIMQPSGSVNDSVKQQDFYIWSIIDDVSDELGGPYFKIVKNTQNIQVGEAYELDIGYPTANLVLSLNIDDNKNYALYYDFQNKINENEYVYRIDNNGKWEQEYAPIISSKNKQHITRPEDKNWWSRVTEYPIKATVVIKGLLRPAILMSHVRLNIYFFGKKHINSGLYLVTKQQDNISDSGYRTTLSLSRISGEEMNNVS